MGPCVKCGAEAVVIPRLNDGFCRECFLAFAIHKFRASIGKAKLIRDEERVLVAYSTGASSTCLLHLIQEGASRRVKKRLRFTSTVVFIDESTVFDASLEERRTTIEHAVTAIQASGFPGIIAHLEDSLKLNIKKNFECYDTILMPEQDIPNPNVDLLEDSLKLNTKNNFEYRDKILTPEHNILNPKIGTEITPDFNPSTFLPNDEDRKTLQTILNSTSSLSAREDLINLLKTRLLLMIAKSVHCTKIAVADCANRLAVTLLSDLARGRGAHLSYNMGFSDARDDDVMFFRPLKDFSSKEVAFYNRLNGLECWSVTTVTTKSNNHTSIERLTQTFINNLQSDYGSTVSNITRTGEKLEATPVAKTDGKSDANMPTCFDARQANPTARSTYIETNEAVGADNVPKTYAHTTFVKQHTNNASSNASTEADGTFKTTDEKSDTNTTFMKQHTNDISINASNETDRKLEATDVAKIGGKVDRSNNQVPEPCPNNTSILLQSAVSEGTIDNKILVSDISNKNEIQQSTNMMISDKNRIPQLEDNKNCSFCYCPLDTNVGKASALHALNVSFNLNFGDRTPDNTLSDDSSKLFSSLNPPSKIKSMVLDDSKVCITSNDSAGVANIINTPLYNVDAIKADYKNCDAVSATSANLDQISDATIKRLSGYKNALCYGCRIIADDIADKGLLNFMM